MKRKELYLNENVVKLLKSLGDKSASWMQNDRIMFDDKLVDVYRNIMKEIAPRKWQPSIIKNVDEETNFTLDRVMSFFSYGEYDYDAGNVYLTIEH